MKRFASTGCALKYDYYEYGKTLTAQVLDIIEAHSKEEARGTTLGFLEKEYPAKNGWGNYCVLAVEIPDEKTTV